MFDKLIDLIKQFGRIFIFWDIITPYEGGIILRLGKYNRNARVGLNWIWPLYIERVVNCCSSNQTLVVGPQSLMTKDGKSVVITIVVTCRVIDPKAFIIDVRSGEQALDDAATGEVSDLIMNSTVEELRNMRLNLRLTNAIKKLAEPWGIEVKKVQIQDLTVTRSLRLIQSVSQTYPVKQEF
jgi:regulator of protease activity HflC (stomatin/prohibitin superfamily)